MNFKKAFEKHQVYLFGYGSLMYPAGVNGRGAMHTYTWNDLSLAVLQGFKREMCACFGWDRFGKGKKWFDKERGLRFYGILPEEKSHCNGVIIPVHTFKDFLNIMHTENAVHITRTEWYDEATYYIDNVTKNVSPRPKNSRIYAVVCPEDRSEYGRWAPNYVTNVWNGVQFWGDEFIEEFLKTGGKMPRQVKEARGLIKKKGKKTGGHKNAQKKRVVVHNVDLR